MSYLEPHILTERSGNNAFAWEKRILEYGKSPTLYVPSIKNGSLSDVKTGEKVVFEEIENGKLYSCIGLENFVRISPSIIVFDNHNHALYFWIEAVRKGFITPGFELIHIDEHSDLWDNENDLDLKKAIKNPEYTWDFTNLSCNVGNYILPAIESGLVGNIIRIENEYQMDTYMDYTPPENSILNLDLDIFAPELDYIPENKKIQIINYLLPRVKYVTIATSPYFIDQGTAIIYLQKIMEKKKE